MNESFSQTRPPKYYPICPRCGRYAEYAGTTMGGDMNPPEDYYRCKCGNVFPDHQGK